MKNTSKFQNVVIATIVGWLVLFVFLPNLMIIATSFLTRDDANFVKLVFTLDNYSRLLDPLYYDVLLHSLNMALLATLACLALGYPLRGSSPGCRRRCAPAAVSADRALLDQLVDPYLRAEDFPQHQRLPQRVSAVAGVIDTPIRIMFTLGGDYRPGLHPAAVYGDAALLQH
jgi:spermidine/putrescine transport system permease protein